jgi:hypothetical protein
MRCRPGRGFAIFLNAYPALNHPSKPKPGCATRVSRGPRRIPQLIEQGGLLVHGAGAGPARVAAGSAGARGSAGSGGSVGNMGFFPAHGKGGKLLVQPLALTFGTGGFLCAQNDSFKVVAALLTDVFKNWHVG